jgi:hypothetical protein
MKQIWPNYSYSPTTNVLTLTGLNIDRDQLLLVTAADRGRIMYNFADSTVTASAFTAGANTGLTLVASTAGLTTTAALVIYYDDQVAGVSGTVTANAGANVATAFYDGIKSWANNQGGDGSLPIFVSVANPNSIIGGGYADLFDLGDSGALLVQANVTNFPATQAISISSVTVGNSITVGSLPVLLSTTTIGGTARLNVTLSSAATPGSIVPSYANLYGGTDGTNLRAISVDTTGRTVVTGTVSLASLPALVAGTAQIGSVTASLAISSTAITSGSFASLTSATLVPANTARKMATVYNLGSGQLFVNAGASCTTLGGGFMVALSSGDYFECDFTTTTLSALFATAGTASWVSH